MSDAARSEMEMEQGFTSHSTQNRLGTEKTKLNKTNQQHKSKVIKTNTETHKSTNKHFNKNTQESKK